MKAIILTVIAAAHLTASTQLFAEDIKYESEISVWVKGGIKPGPLASDDLFITAVPGINLQRFYVPVDICADECEGEKHFLSLVCGMGNEYHVSAKGVAVTYLGTSCHWPSKADVIVPSAEKYIAKVRLDIPTDEIGWPATIVPTAFVDSFTSSIVDLGAHNCAQAVSERSPKGGPQRLSIQTYASDHDGAESGILANKDICVSVTPKGAGIQRLTVNGGVYGLNAGSSHFLGSFQCEFDNRLQEGKEYRQSIASCGHAPVKPRLAYWSGQLEVRLTAHISSADGIGIWREVPVQSYPPMELK